MLLETTQYGDVLIAKLPEKAMVLRPNYEPRYSHKARKNWRRLMRRLEEKGSIQTTRHTGGGEARATALAAIALKRTMMWAARRPSEVTSMAMRPLQRIVVTAQPAGPRRASATHDPAFQRLSPGTPAVAGAGFSWAGRADARL